MNEKESKNEEPHKINQFTNNSNKKIVFNISTEPTPNESENKIETPSKKTGAIPKVKNVVNGVPEVGGPDGAPNKALIDQIEVVPKLTSNSIEKTKECFVSNSEFSCAGPSSKSVIDDNLEVSSENSDFSSDTGNDELSYCDDYCIYTYKGDIADLPSSFMNLDQENNENGSRDGSRGSSPEMDFLEMDFDPGPSNDIESDNSSLNIDLEETFEHDHNNLLSNNHNLKSETLKNFTTIESPKNIKQNYGNLNSNSCSWSNNVNCDAENYENKDIFDRGPHYSNNGTPKNTFETIDDKGSSGITCSETNRYFENVPLEQNELFGRENGAVKKRYPYEINGTYVTYGEPFNKNGTFDKKGPCDKNGIFDETGTPYNKGSHFGKGKTPFDKGNNCFDKNGTNSDDKKGNSTENSSFDKGTLMEKGTHLEKDTHFEKSNPFENGAKFEKQPQFEDSTNFEKLPHFENGTHFKKSTEFKKGVNFEKSTNYEKWPQFETRNPFETWSQFEKDNSLEKETQFEKLSQLEKGTNYEMETSFNKATKKSIPGILFDKKGTPISAHDLFASLETSELQNTFETKGTSFKKTKRFYEMCPPGTIFDKNGTPISAQELFTSLETSEPKNQNTFDASRKNRQTNSFGTNIFETNNRVPKRERKQNTNAKIPSSKSDDLMIKNIREFQPQPSCSKSESNIFNVTTTKRIENQNDQNNFDEKIDPWVPKNPSQRTKARKFALNELKNHHLTGGDLIMYNNENIVINSSDLNFKGDISEKNLYLDKNTIPNSSEMNFSIEKTMIWSEQEALSKQTTQIATSSCGATAVINVLKALNYEIPPNEKVLEAVSTRLRQNNSQLLKYLQSRSWAGSTHQDLILGLEKLSDNRIYSRFFPTYPERYMNLSIWLSHWIKLGAIPIATLNLQKIIGNNGNIPDSWHHQMIFGVGPNGIYLTNPLERVDEGILWHQLNSDSEILIRKEDVISRFDFTNLKQMMNLEDVRWKRFNVVGQIANVVREHRLKSKIFSRTHVNIPASYRAGITLCMEVKNPNCEMLRTCSELPIYYDFETA